MLSIILFLDSIGGGELLVVLFVVLLFFGSKGIPDIAKGLGKGMREFKNAMNDVRSEIENTINDEPEKKQVTEPREELKKDTEIAESQEIYKSPRKVFGQEDKSQL